MIKGHKPSGYVETFDLNGNVIERETRQCSHCQFTWVYQPGSGNQRGFCRHCMSVLCGKPQCQKSCAPFSEVVEDDRYEMTNGIFVRR